MNGTSADLSAFLMLSLSKHEEVVPPYFPLRLAR